MCITTREASLQNTYLLVANLPNGNHLLIYQNEARTENTNAMILPIDTEKMGVSSLKEYPSAYLSDMYEKISCVRAGLNSQSVISGKCGSYDVHIINELNEAAFVEINALGVGLEKALYDWYNAHYPSWSFAFCVFDEKAIGAEKHPIGIEYVPRNAEWLHFPLVDSHTGGVPKREKVEPHQICLCPDEGSFRNVFMEDLGMNLNAITFEKLRTTNDDMWVRVGTEDVHDLPAAYRAGNMLFKLPSE